MVKSESKDLQVDCIPASLLTIPMMEAWRGIIASQPSLSSPLFAPEYTQTIAAALPGVFVALGKAGDEFVAFLPFERDKSGIGHRLHLCDFQGLIARSDLDCDVRSFVRRAGLRAWDFDHLLASQQCFAPFHRRIVQSPVINLAAGYEAYVAERRAAGTDSIKKSGNLLRRLEREIGPLRFEVQVRDPALLRQLLLWRAAKYQSRHPFELLEAILLRFLSLQQDGCRGTLSVLYAGDAIVASHFGLRSRNRWHYWFPAYNAQFEKYSAGIILLLKIAEIACTMGIHTIDLGMGEEDYKRRLMNGSLQIAEGSVQVSSLLSFTRSFRRHAGLVLRRAPVLNSLARRLVGAGETTPASAQVLPS